MSSSSSTSTAASTKRGVKRKRETGLAPNNRKDESPSDSSSEDSESGSDSEDDASKGKAKVISQSRKELAGNPTPVSEDSTVESDSNDDKLEEGNEEEEVKVLSHAEKRRLKKKDKTVKEKDSLTNKKPGKDVKTTNTGTLPKRQNSVWIGNLAFKTTEQSLREFFKRRVPECEITRINLPTKTGRDVSGGKGGMRGENRGWFAYVDFSTKEAQQAAINLSEQNLDGRKLLIKDGDDFKGRPTSIVEDKAGAQVAQSSPAGKSKTAQKILATQKQAPAPTLFFGNLGFQTTEESIKNMLDGHRKKNKEKDNANTEESPEKKKWIRKIRLGTFEDTGNCKGWAFVDFYNIEDATAVLIDPHNHHLDGRNLVVEYASPEAVRRGGGPRLHRDKDELQKANRKNGKSRDNRFTEPEEDTEQPATKKPKIFGEEDKGKKGGKPKRTKPGAALASAQREKIAIVPSTGKKIKF